jgi:hypothetical protein
MGMQRTTAASTLPCFCLQPPAQNMVVAGRDQDEQPVKTLPDRLVRLHRGDPSSTHTPTFQKEDLTLMVMVMNAIAGSVGECFVKTRHQSPTVLAEFVQDLRQSRQVVAAWETALMLLKLWLRPVQIID